jgi:hypothetical protein
MIVFEEYSFILTHLIYYILADTKQNKINIYYFINKEQVTCQIK